jgi:hypothetical protein
MSVVKLVTDASLQIEVPTLPMKRPPFLTEHRLNARELQKLASPNGAGLFQ